MIPSRQYFLDGLRGWASLNVAIVHIFFDVLPPMDTEKMHPQFWWPASGSFSVAIFFIVSGFALSTNFYRTGDRKSLGRMAVGRYLRLTIPIFAICAIVSLLFISGVIVVGDLPPRFKGYFAFEPSMANLLRFSLFDVYFNYDSYRSYVGPLWTMSYELIGSAFVFCLLFLTRPERFWPLYMVGGLLLFLLMPYYYLFLIGMVCAWQFDRMRGRLPGWMGLGLILLCLAIGRIDSERLFAVVAVCTFVVVLISPVAISLLSTRLSKFLGDLSFPLYLVHGPVIFAVGIPLYQRGFHWLAPFVTLAASVLAAIMLMPVNDFATWASRAVGGLMVKRRPEALRAEA